VESAASCGKIKDFPTGCLENSFGVSHTSHNPRGCLYIFFKKGRNLLTRTYHFFIVERRNVNGFQSGNFPPESLVNFTGICNLQVGF
jgi:hypothetical protein